jgi:hypothetical protein
MQDLEDENDLGSGNEDETRSLHAEHDYTRKDATRHIVTATAGTRDDRLRMKLLRNLEGVRKNKPICKSEVGSVQSMRSRFSKASAKNSQTPGGANDGRLTRIEENDGENHSGAHCEACNRENITEEDQLMNEDISK